MIRPQRRNHLRLWLIITPIAAIALAAALITRPPEPRQPASQPTPPQPPAETTP